MKLSAAMRGWVGLPWSGVSAFLLQRSAIAKKAAQTRAWHGR